MTLVKVEEKCDLSHSSPSYSVCLSQLHKETLSRGSSPVKISLSLLNTLIDGKNVSNKKDNRKVNKKLKIYKDKAEREKPEFCLPIPNLGDEESMWSEEFEPQTSPSLGNGLSINSLPETRLKPKKVFSSVSGCPSDQVFSPFDEGANSNSLAVPVPQKREIKQLNFKGVLLNRKSLVQSQRDNSLNNGLEGNVGFSIPRNETSSVKPGTVKKNVKFDIFPKVHRVPLKDNSRSRCQKKIEDSSEDSFYSNQEYPNSEDSEPLYSASDILFLDF